ncbi:MAG: hypothetical protein P8Z74_13790 [Acidobacteriota bacterium]
MEFDPSAHDQEGAPLRPVHIRCRLRSFWTVLVIGFLDLGLAIFLMVDRPGGFLFLLGPLLILLMAAVWMFFQAWGYWILRIETEAESLRIRAPRERFGIFLPPAEDFRCDWSEIKDVRLPGLDNPRKAGMVYRMPIVALLVTTRDGRGIQLPYSMLKGQVQEMAALISRRAKGRSL